MHDEHMTSVLYIFYMVIYLNNIKDNEEKYVLALIVHDYVIVSVIDTKLNHLIIHD